MMPSSATALSALSDFNSKRQSAQDIYNTANTQYDVGGGQQRVSALNSQVGNLQSSLDAVDPSVTGRTAGTFTTEGQRSALVGREQAPIATNLSRTQSNLGTQQQNLSTSQGLASQLASAMIGQDQTKYQGLLDQYNSAVAAEQAAEQKRQYEADMAEKQREFDATQAATAAAAKASGAGSYDLGGGNGGGTTSATTNPLQVQAQNALTGLFKTNNVNTIANTIKAITDSANRGNTYDQLKLQLLGQYKNSAYGSILNKAMSLTSNNAKLKNGGGGLA